MKKIDSMNLVPFIDIMLVLLVIVMVSASFNASSNLPIQIPKVDEKQESVTPPKRLNIAFDKSGAIFVDSQSVDKAGLYAFLRQVDSNTSIIIKADKDASVQQFIDVMSALSYFGLTNVFTEVSDD